MQFDHENNQYGAAKINVISHYEQIPTINRKVLQNYILYDSFFRSQIMT